MNRDMMLAGDHAMPNLALPCDTGFPRRMPEQSVFPDVPVVCTPPLSPRSGPTPGITLTVEGTAPEVISVAESSGHPHHHRSGSIRSSRRGMPSSSVQRSPSANRMRRNTSSNKLREPGSGVSRSQSMRTARRPQSADPSHRFRQRISSIPNDLTLPSDGTDRLASNQSLPLPGEDADILRLRNFAVTPKGVVNRGDSFRSKSRSTHSVSSVGSGRAPPIPAQVAAASTDDSAFEGETDEPTAQAIAYSNDVVESEAQVPRVEASTAAAAAAPVVKTARYRVLVLGSTDVGKTALTRQFMTSEYICSYDGSQDEDNEQSVTVVLNGEESELVFIEHTFQGDPNDNFASTYLPDAYLVVYSVTSKRSLQVAKEIARLVHRLDNTETKPVILVGNKTDLVRHRVLTIDDGRSLAMEESCKFIETSAGINHNVDELLVGILTQIRLKLSSVERHLRKRESVSLGQARARCAGCAGCKAKGFIKRFLKKACSRTKSCDNLHVL